MAVDLGTLSERSPTVTLEQVERRSRLIWGLVAAAVVGVGYLIVLARSFRFFYQDDTDGGAVPVWIDVGSSLRSGNVPILEPEQWMAGNYAVEGQLGLFNPAQVVISLLAPSFDDLNVYATLVKLIFAITLATGVYRTALEYGAQPHWAAAAGSAVPFSGFVLYYDSATWVTGLMGAAWLSQAWASSVRLARGRSSPFPAFAFLYLTLSVGYVHAAIMAGVLIGVLMLTEAWSREWWAAVRLAGVGLAAALCGAITFLPGVLSVGVTWRDLDDSLQNDGFLSAPWSETLAMSLPSNLPAIPGFGGEIHGTPITYVAWFALPAMAFIRWERLFAEWRALQAPVLMLSVVLFMTAGPSVLGPLRWPARLLPYVAMTLLLIVAVLLSCYRAARLTPGRLAAAVMLVGANVVRAASANPDLVRRHVLTGVLVVLAMVVALAVVRWLGARACALWLMAGTLVSVGLMVRWHPENSDVNQWDFPPARSAAVAAFPDYPGSTLQIGTYSLVSRPERTLDDAWSDLVFGNYARFLQQEYVNAYTPIGFADFSDRLCMDYAGSTCPEAYDRLFETEASTGLRLVDLMAVDRIVLQRELFPVVPNGGAPSGWGVTEQNDTVIVLERSEPREDNGSRVVASPGVSVESLLSVGGEHEHLLVSSPSGGRVVFARLPWPGYEARLDGRSVPVNVIDDLFVSVQLPPTADAVELRLAYRPPGYRLGMALAGAGAVLLVTGVLWDRRQRSTSESLARRGE